MPGETYQESLVRNEKLSAQQAKSTLRSLEIFRAASKRHNARRKALLTMAEGFHTKEDLKAIRTRQGDRCVYCKTHLNGKGYRDHIAPLILGGSNHPENMQWLCKRCSDFKGSKPEQQFLAEMR